MQTRAVRVGHVSDLASEREIHEFFSFSGEIEHIEIRREIGQTLTALEVPKKLFHSQESDDVLNSEVDSSVSSKFHPYNYQVTSQVTDTNSLNSAQASQYEDAESGYNHQASSKFGSFFDLQPPGMDKFDGLSVPYYPVPISSAARKEPNQPFKLTIREDPVPVLDNNTDRGSNMDSKLIDLNARPQRIHGEASNDQTGLMGKTLLEFQSNKGDVLPAHKFGTRDVVVLKLNKADLGSPPSGRGVVYRRFINKRDRNCSVLITMQRNSRPSDSPSSMPWICPPPRLLL